MARAWQQLDLESGGLQTVNAALSLPLRRRGTAYALWVAFPAGLHRFYLHEPLGGVTHILLASSALALVLLGPAHAWLIPMASSALFAAFDLWWLDRRVDTCNKQLRMKLYLRPGQQSPAGYRGRYGEEMADGDLDQQG